MKKAIALTLLALVCSISVVQASTVTSAFVDFIYTYTVTPAPGEAVRSFHIYTQGFECDPTHYYDRVMPAGWMFDTLPEGDNCVITFWTDGEPLPVGETTDFGFTHYCLPCCNSWYLGEPGTADPYVDHVDGDENHGEPCNIPPEYADACFGGGLILAPQYPVMVGTDGDTWGAIRSLYR